MRALARCLAAFSVVAAALVAADVAIVPAAQAAGTTVTVTDGGAPGWIRFDDQGNGVDAHDGEIKQFGSKYYLYGTAYGCGYVRLHGYRTDTRPVTPFCGFVVYESTDLRHWKYDGPLFDPATTSPTNWQQICNSATLSCYRPHVLYDAASGHYRLWVNTYDTAADGIQHGYHVLSSTSPTGPFTEQTVDGAAVLPKLGYDQGGDFDLYQDTNGAGYIVYAVTGGDPLGRNYDYKLVVEALSRNYMTGTGNFTTLDTAKTEAPSMFRRGSDYYITMSDPQCAYCAGTGTAYLRAKSPLGPWRGTGSNVALSNSQMYVDSLIGMFKGADSTTQSQLATLRDYDVSFRARPLPDTTTAKTHTTRIGWMFRSQTPSNGYLWILSSAPYAGKPARLSREVVYNGRVINVTTVGIPAAPSTTALNTVRTRVVGTMVKTWLNGKVIDKFTVNKWSDKHFHAGYVGVRQTVGYSAYYDDFMLSRPPALGFQVYLAENFNTQSLANFPTFNRFRRSGVRISDTSCGGQPDDVAMLRAPNSAGYEYLFQSDRWDSGDQNEGQATQYWEPMKFNADGTLQALTCGVQHTAVLTDAVLSQTPTVDGFTEAQDITSTHSRGQSFQVTTASNLTSVALTLFQTDVGGNAPTADLIVSVYDVGGPNGVPGASPIGTPVTVPQSTISWSPTTVTVPITAALSPNPDGSPHQYAIVVSTVSTTGAYGVARADGTTGDQDPTGAGLVTGSDGTWTVEPTNDLRYALTTSTS